MINRITGYERAIMKRRGFSSDEEMLAYLNKDPESLPRFSSLLNGKAVLSGINDAVDEGREITVYGDYDADGVMAMTILYRGLTKLSPGRINWFANDRFRDGYSITVDSLGHLLDRFPDTEVIVTCDNGIGAAEAWEEALNRGLSVFVTDHHQQGEDRVPDPSIPAVCENSVAQKEIFAREGRTAEGFCGAELVRRLISELYEIRGIADENREFLNSLYAYAGIATIADVIGLNANNHCVARAAIDIIRADTGFWQVFNSIVTGGKVQQSGVDGDTFGFYYAPAINACSRVEGGVELPMSVFLYDGHDPGTLSDLINRMSTINNTRKEWTEEDKNICERIISDNGYEDAPFILVADDRLREGINGLSAGAVTNKYGVPAIVLGASGIPGVYKGSARSVDSVNIYEKLTQCAGLLETFGGHPKAAGLSIKEENIEEFRRRMTDCVAADLVREEIRAGDGDITLDPTSFTVANIRAFTNAMDNLQPFGEGFLKPLMYLEADVDPADNGIFYMSDGVHAKLKLNVRSADDHDIYVLMWRRGSYVSRVVEEHGNGNIHLRGMMQLPEINDYNGRISYQMAYDKIELE